MIDKKRKGPLDLVPIILGIVIISVFIAALFYPMDMGWREGYEYTGVDCYIRFNVTRSLSNLTEIMDNLGFTYDIWFNRSSPENPDEIIDFIKFSFISSSQKYIPGYIYNFDSDNISIKLHYYSGERITYFDKTYDEVRNLTYPQHLEDMVQFENELGHIISLFESEFDTTLISIIYIHSI